MSSYHKSQVEELARLSGRTISDVERDLRWEEALADRFEEKERAALLAELERLGLPDTEENIRRADHSLREREAPK